MKPIRRAALRALLSAVGAVLVACGSAHAQTSVPLLEPKPVFMPGMYETVTTLRDRGSKRAADDPRGRQHGHGTGVRRGAVELPSLKRHPNGNC